MEEIWKDIKGYEGLYQVSDMGQIKSLERKVKKRNGYRILKEKILKPNINKHGYLGIILFKNYKVKRYLIARLVAIHFISNPDNKPEVNHIDGIKEHCYKNNLEWNTSSENKKHAHRIGLINFKGVKNNFSKLTNEMVRLIRNSPSLTQCELASIFNCKQNNISRILNNKRWSNV